MEGLKITSKSVNTPRQYISTSEETHEHHRSHIILHENWHYYFAEFDTIEQLDFFAKTLGFNYELTEERETEHGIYRQYAIDRNIVDNKGFWKLADLPENAKPIKALSNGSIVDCYFTNNGTTIDFFRPNPNAKEVYKPLSTELHIAHKKIYGSY